MKITEVNERSDALAEELLAVWESSVRATHLFLSPEEIESIKEYVPEALRKVPVLIIAENEQKISVGFMGIAKEHLEMLFVADQERGKGIGKALLNYGVEKYGLCSLAVNEQNSYARAFYEHMGFAVYRRSELDEQGNPYPLLYMKRER